MIKLDDNLLAELGLADLPKEEKSAFLKHMYETLEMRVGTRLAERMSDAQMAEFEQFINSNDEQGAFQWLESNFPDYKQVVQEEFDKLKTEIKPVAAQILASSQMQATSQVGPAQDTGTPAEPAYQPPQPGQAVGGAPQAGYAPVSQPSSAQPVQSPQPDVSSAGQVPGYQTPSAPLAPQPPAAAQTGAYAAPPAPTPSQSLQPNQYAVPPAPAPYAPADNQPAAGHYSAYGGQPGAAAGAAGAAPAPSWQSPQPGTGGTGTGAASPSYGSVSGAAGQPAGGYPSGAGGASGSDPSQSAAPHSDDDGQ